MQHFVPRFRADADDIDIGAVSQGLGGLCYGVDKPKPKYWGMTTAHFDVRLMVLTHGVRELPATSDDCRLEAAGSSNLPIGPKVVPVGGSYFCLL